VINPVYWLELRIRAREKRLWIIAIFFIGALLVISGVVMGSVLLQGAWRLIEPSSIGEGLIWSALFCQAGLLIILAPLATAGRISQEREQRTLPALVNSTLPARRIALGKLYAAFVFVCWLGVLVLPFLFMAYLWGGPSITIILACVTINILAGLCLACVSLGLSGLFGRSLTSYLITGAFLFGWIVVVPLLGSLAMVLHQDGSETYQNVIAYLAWYHHPFFPLMTLVSTDWALNAREAITHLLYAVAVWTAIGGLHLALAVKGLKREVY
jgi:ABC-type transport system involved in multi-copper enzyme maturation permease subunit